ncbi:hypothetical protein K8S17_00640, partial [bacterium]|nr:hypothetical protein [bacterium]
STTTTFNDNVEAMALARISGGDSIVLVDLECGAGMDYREVPDGDMYDYLHPTDNGYWKMAGGWFAHLKDMLSPIDAPHGMTHYWKLEDAGGPPYVNAMGAGDATCSGCPTYTFDGRAWGCLEFDGEDDEVQVPDDGSFDWGVDDSFTIEFWMKKDTACNGGSVSDNEVIVGRDDPGTQLHWWVGVNCGQTPGGVACFNLQDTGHGGQSISGSTVLTDGEWHHVVAVRDASADSTLLYIDGTREASAGYDYTGGFDGATSLDIGFLTLDERFRYEGLVDEIALYDRALSESEIFAHHIGGLDGKGYAQSSDGSPCFTSDPVTEVRVGEVYAYDAEAGGAPAPSFSLGAHPAAMQIESVSGLVTWLPGASNVGSHFIDVIATNAVGADTQSFVLDVLEEVVCPDDMSHYWPLDDGSGATPDDYYSTLDATLHGSPSWTTGVVGDAVEFDGTSQYMTVPDDVSIDWGADDSFTVEVWAKFTNYSAKNKVMVGRDNRPGGCHWWVGASEATGAASFYLRDDDDQGAACTGSVFMADGEWHHIVAVRDNAANMNRLYVDGVLDDAVYFDYGAGWGAGTTLGIGYMAYTGTPDYFYDGVLDEIALYDRALSLPEIDEHYTNGLAGQGYCNLTETAPVITTSPVASAMVGILYSYDADAAGHPAPAFSLGACPATMQVNTATGLVTWTPQTGAEGPHLVELMATSTAGADTQFYTITVLEAPECPSEMTAYWRLDEQTGPIYEDSFGLHDGTSASAPTAVAGLIADAQRFDGYNDSISVSGHSDFNWGRDASFTIEYWMRKDTPCGGNTVPYNEVIVGRDDNGTGATDIHWWTGVSCWEMPQGTAVFQLRDENREGVHVRGTTFLLDGDWHHIVCVRDGAVDTNRIYVDGSLEGTIHYDYGAGFSSADGQPIGFLLRGRCR